MGEAAAFLEASLRTAMPLALAALGELLTEKSGTINVGLEGAVMMGCYGAVVGAGLGGGAGALVGGLFAGALCGVVLGFFVVRLAADAIIAGTAITIGAYGLSGLLYRLSHGADGVALRLPTLASVEIPGLARLPGVGPVVFAQPVTSYLVVLLAVLIWWGLFRTHVGVGLRAVGEHSPAAAAAGLSVARYRWFGIVVGSALGGLAGALLVLGVGTFTEQMSAGRGYIALAVVALGRWSPWGVMLAAFLFGSTSALQFRFQASGSSVPYQAFLALPYALTLAVLVAGAGRSGAPAGLNRVAR